MTKGKGKGKRAYVAKEKRERKRAKQTSEEDINQNFEIKTLKNKVSELTAGTKNFAFFKNDSLIVPTILDATTNDVSISNLAMTIPSNIKNGSGLQNPIAVLDGPYINIKHIGLNYCLNMDPDSNSDDVGTSMLCRVLMLCVHQPAGKPGIPDSSVAPSWSEIFMNQQTISTNLTSADVMAQYTRLNRHNFEVLYDKIHNLSPSLVAENGAPYGVDKPFTHVERLSLVPQKRSMRVAYNDTDAAPNTDIGGTAQNTYYLLAFTDNPNAANGAPVTITYSLVVDYVE